jgi:hypothetical protein
VNRFFWLIKGLFLACFSLAADTGTANSTGSNPDQGINWAKKYSSNPLANSCIINALNNSGLSVKVGNPTTHSLVSYVLTSKI